jgi:lipoprotein-releasing system permease protein
LKVGAFLAKKIILQKQQAFSGFVIRLSVIATAFSVAIMILTLAFVAGFQEAIAEKVFSFWGHIRVQQHPSYSSDLSEESQSFKSDTITQIIRSNKEVRYVDVYATKAALLKSASNMDGVMLKGVDSGFSVQRMKSFMIKGGWLSFESDRPTIIISAYTARLLSLDVGDKAYLYFMNNNTEAPRIRAVKVAGIYKTAIEEYDRSFAIVDLSMIQKLQDWNNQQISGYEITLHNYHADRQMVNHLLDVMPLSWFANSLRDIYPNIFDWLDLQDVNRTLIIVIMCIVAVINLISCLMILVLERSKMIGLLKALGAENGLVQQIFWRHGLYISLKGVLWGTVLGVLLCMIQQYTGIIRLDESAYYLRVAPVKLIGWHVLLIDAGTVLICFLVLLLPSLLVRNIQPVKVLRFE